MLTSIWSVTPIVVDTHPLASQIRDAPDAVIGTQLHASHLDAASTVTGCPGIHQGQEVGPGLHVEIDVAVRQHCRPGHRLRHIANLGEPLLVKQFLGND